MKSSEGIKNKWRGEALCDTGASSSLLSSRIAGEMKCEVREVKERWKGAVQKFDTKGQVDLNVIMLASTQHPAPVMTTHSMTTTTTLDTTAVTTTHATDDRTQTTASKEPQQGHTTKAPPLHVGAHTFTVVENLTKDVILGRDIMNDWHLTGPRPNTTVNDAAPAHGSEVITASPTATMTTHTTTGPRHTDDDDSTRDADDLDECDNLDTKVNSYIQNDIMTDSKYITLPPEVKALLSRYCSVLRQE